MRPLGNNGLSAAELLVVSAIFGVLTLVLYSTFRFQTSIFNRESASGITQDELRTWSLRMMRDIRRSGYDPRGSKLFGIVVATPTEFRATADHDRDGSVSATNPLENVGFRLNGATLERWMGGTSWRPVVHGVTTFTFSYLNAQRQTVNQTPPYTTYADIAEVDFSVSARSATGGLGGAAGVVLSQTGKARLRNLQ